MSVIDNMLERLNEIEDKLNDLENLLEIEEPEDDVNSIKKILWTVAVVAGTQMIIIVRELLVRGI